MNVQINVDEERRPPIALDFGVCELTDEKRNDLRTKFAINFCLFFTASAICTAVAYFLP